MKHLKYFLTGLWWITLRLGTLAVAIFVLLSLICGMLAIGSVEPRAEAAAKFWFFANSGAVIWTVVFLVACYLIGKNQKS